jgi:hypothetical protein
MGGITSATILTLFYLPALYAMSFRVRADEREPQTPSESGTTASGTTHTGN